MIKRITFLPLLILMLAVTGFAQTGQTDTIAAQAAQVTEFEVNGLKVLVKRRPSSPTVAAALFIRGGSRNSDEKNAGIEDLTLKSAIEAGKKYDRQTVRRETSRTGSGIGAAAGMDYSLITLGTTRPHFDRIWDIFTDVVLNPAFAPDDIERNRQATLTGLSVATVSPEGAVQAEIARVIYAGHQYGNPVAGTVETVKNFKPDDLKAYHKKVMTTSQLLLVFVGDLDPNDVKQRISASFGKLPRGDYKEKSFPPLKFSAASVDIVARPNLPTNYVEGVFEAPPLGSTDYYPMQAAISILNQLVVREVRENRQLSYAPGSEMHKFAVNTANISVSSVDANESVRLMLEQIGNLRKFRLNDDIVAEVAGNFLVSYYLTQETSGAQVAELARYELIGGGWRRSFEFLDRMRQVTSADVNRVSARYMKNLRFVVVGNPAAVNRSIFLQSQ